MKERESESESKVEAAEREKRRLEAEWGSKDLKVTGGKWEKEREDGRPKEAERQWGIEDYSRFLGFHCFDILIFSLHLSAFCLTKPKVFEIQSSLNSHLIYPVAFHKKKSPVAKAQKVWLEDPGSDIVRLSEFVRTRMDR